MNNWWCSETLVRSVRKLTRESFLLLVLLLGTIGAVVHGFLITNINSLFLLRHDDPNTIDLFSKHLLLLTLVGEMLGAISSFLFSDSFGRKTTLFYATIGCILALLLEVFAGGHARLLTARFLVGWTIGTMLPVGLTYISEIFPIEHRGLAVSCLSVLSALGSTASAAGYALAGIIWSTQISCPQWLSVLPILLLIPTTLLLTAVPESHRWLLAVKTPSECLVAMRQLRRPTDVSKEFNEIYSALSSDARLGDGWTDLLSNRSLWQRIGVCGVLQLSQGLVGSCLISVLATDMFVAARASSPVALLTVMYIFCLGGSALCAHKVDQWGRRWMLIGGYFAISLCWTGALFCVHYSRMLGTALSPSFPLIEISPSSSPSITSASSIVPSTATAVTNQSTAAAATMTTSISGIEVFGLHLSIATAGTALQNIFIFFILLFSFVFSATIGPIVNVVSMEVFPFRVRGKAASLLYGLGLLSSLIGAFVLRPWARAIIIIAPGHALDVNGHMVTSMVAYLLSSLALSVFVLLALPETTVLALEDMEELFDAGQSGVCSSCIGFRNKTKAQNKANTVPSHGSDPNLKNSSGNRPSVAAATDQAPSVMYYEPSTLHKYSSEMRDSKFLTYWEPEGEEDLLLGATSSSSGNWALSFLPDAPGSNINSLRH